MRPRSRRSSTSRSTTDVEREVVGVLAPRPLLVLVLEAVRLPRHAEAQLVPRVVGDHVVAVVHDPRRSPAKSSAMPGRSGAISSPAPSAAMRSTPWNTLSASSSERGVVARPAWRPARRRRRRGSTRTRRRRSRGTTPRRWRSACATRRTGRSGAWRRAATAASPCGCSRGTRARRCAPPAPGPGPSGWRTRSPARSPGVRGLRGRRRRTPRGTGTARCRR